MAKAKTKTKKLATWKDVKNFFDSSLLEIITVNLPDRKRNFEIKIEDSPWRQAGTEEIPCAKCVAGKTKADIYMQLDSVRVEHGTVTMLHELETDEEKELYLALFRENYLVPTWKRVDTDEDGLTDHLARFNHETGEYETEEND
jgi:hypothetical protein